MEDMIMYIPRHVYVSYICFMWGRNCISDRSTRGVVSNYYNIINKIKKFKRIIFLSLNCLYLFNYY